MTTSLNYRRMAETVIGDIGKEWQPEHPEGLAAGAGQEGVYVAFGVHMVFSLEPNKMECTDTMEHSIVVTNSEPFKENHSYQKLQSTNAEMSIGSFCVLFILFLKSDCN